MKKRSLFSFLVCGLVLARPALAQNYNAAQQLALGSIPADLSTQATAAHNALVAASFSQSPGTSAISERVADLAKAELALAMARADLISRLQASPNRLNPTQLDQVAQQAAGRGARGGRGGGAAQNAIPFANAPKTLLWPDGAPGALGEADSDKPPVAIYLAPKRADGKPAPAVVMFPGGAYAAVSVDGGEGSPTAQWFNSMGVSAFIVRYRVSPYRYPAEIDDGRRAIQLVRARAAEFGVDPNRIGVMGFSAGGHLAAYTASVFEPGKPDATDPVDRVSSRPDFAMLFYPVITFNPEVAGAQSLNAYAGTGRNLLGASPSAGLADQMSVETRVTRSNPPTFLYHGSSDTLVAPENSFRFFLALRKAGVASELHTFERGAHATGISAGDPLQGALPDILKTWLRLRGIVSFEVP